MSGTVVHTISSSILPEKFVHTTSGIVGKVLTIYYLNKDNSFARKHITIVVKQRRNSDRGDEGGRVSLTDLATQLAQPVQRKQIIKVLRRKKGNGIPLQPVSLDIKKYTTDRWAHLTEEPPCKVSGVQVKPWTTASCCLSNSSGDPARTLVPTTRRRLRTTPSLASALFIPRIWLYVRSGLTSSLYLLLVGVRQCHCVMLWTVSTFTVKAYIAPLVTAWFFVSSDIAGRIDPPVSFCLLALTESLCHFHKLHPFTCADDSCVSLWHARGSDPRF